MKRGCVLLGVVCLFSFSDAHHLPAEDAVPRKRVALVLRAYDNRKDDFVQTAVAMFSNDARDLAKQLARQGWQSSYWTTLHSPELVQPAENLPSAANLRRYLKDTKSLQPADEVVIILVGHSVTLEAEEPSKKTARVYFCPEDANYEKLTRISEVKENHHLVAIDEIYEVLKACPARKKLLILVTALSATLGKPEHFPPPLCARLPKLPVPPAGLAVFTSCAEGEFTSDRANFLEHLLEGLAGFKADGTLDGQKRDGAVSLEELVAYAQRRTQEQANQYGKRSVPQHPTVMGRLARDWVLAGKAPESRWKLLKAPFPAKEAQERQADVARILKLKDSVVSNGLGMKLTVIPAGEFRLGSDKGYDDERPRPRIALPRPYFLGQHEVTQKQYREVMGDNPSAFHTVPGQDADAFPVEQVTFKQVVLFCNALSEREKLPPYYRLFQPSKDEKTGRVINFADYTPVGGQGYRLPTEAEWEWACRAGTETPFSVGDALDGKQANIDAGRPSGVKPGAYLGRPTRVGSYAPNAFGLYDMHGNVAERCEESYDARRYKELMATVTDGAGVIGYGGLVRGGAWNLEPRDCTSSVRVGVRPEGAFKFVGFRVARDAE